MPFCENCKHPYAFDELSDQTADGVGELNCPKCGSVLIAKNDFTPVDAPRPTAKGTWEVSPEGKLNRPIIVRTDLTNFVGE